MTKETVKPTIRHWMMIKWLRIGLNGSDHIKPFMKYPRLLNSFLDAELTLDELDALEKEFYLARVIMTDTLSDRSEYHFKPALKQ